MLCFGILKDRAIDQLIDLVFGFERVTDSSELLRLLEANTVETKKPH
jgi:hypothetical protein